MVGKGLYEPGRFSGWSELTEGFVSGHIRATFTLAPLAMTLRQPGIPIEEVGQR